MCTAFILGEALSNNLRRCFLFVLSVLSIFSFDFMSSACMFPQSADLLTDVYMRSALPVGLCALIGVSFYTLSRRPGANFEELRSSHTYNALLLSYLTVPAVSLKQFQVTINCTKFLGTLTISCFFERQALDCVKIAGGIYVRVDTSVNCVGSKYNLFRSVNGLVIFI